MGFTDLPDPVVVGERSPSSAGAAPGPFTVAASRTDLALPAPVRLVVDRERRYNLWVFNLGLACCAVEFAAASMTSLAGVAADPGDRQGRADREADVMVVSGTVTDKLAPAVAAMFEQLPEPRYVLSFGACAACGGPYWDSYSVTKGVDQLIPVDVYVPGCPPRPEALVQGLQLLSERIRAAEQAEQ